MLELLKRNLSFEQDDHCLMLCTVRNIGLYPPMITNEKNVPKDVVPLALKACKGLLEQLMSEGRSNRASGLFNEPNHAA